MSKLTPYQTLKAMPAEAQRTLCDCVIHVALSNPPSKANQGPVTLSRQDFDWMMLLASAMVHELARAMEAPTDPAPRAGAGVGPKPRPPMQN